MAEAAVCSKVVFLVLQNHLFIVTLMVWGVSLCITLLSVLTSFAIILMEKRELVALLQLSSWCLGTASAMWLYLAIQWVGLQCVIVVFPGHTRLLLSLKYHI